jgi:magnesium transporter
METMNVVPLAAPVTDPIASEGVVAASVYVDGRRVANIAIDEASSWRSKSGHVVWIGLYEPDLALLTSVQQQFDLHDLAIEDANMPISGLKSNSMAKPCSSWRGRRN